MRATGLLPALILTTWATACHAAAQVDEAASFLPAPCSRGYHADQAIPIEDPGRLNLALYPELCDGGLYLIDTSAGASLLRVNPVGWWLEEAGEVEVDANGSFVVEASFITGVGPTGVVPFTVRYRVSSADDGRWVSEALPRDESQPVWLGPDVVEITRPEQLEHVALADAHGPIEIPVDFSRDRLLLKPIWPTSGSIRITDVEVHRTDRAYFVSHDEHSPRVGTADMKPVVIYAVLPADYRAVSFDDPEYGAERVRAEAGVLEGATVEGRRAP